MKEKKKKIRKSYYDKIEIHLKILLRKKNFVG